MRKVTILTVLLVCVAFVGAYAEPVVEPTVSGSVTLDFGVDLNEDMTAGFEASTKGLRALLTLVDEYSAEKGADGEAVYGWIEMKEINFAWDNENGINGPDPFNPVDSDDKPTDQTEVTARIMFGDVAWLQIYNSVSKVAFNYGSIINIDPRTGYGSDETNEQHALGGLTVQSEDATSPDYPGITLGVDVDPVMFKLYFMDIDNGFDKTDEDNPENDWLLAMSAGLDMTIITFDIYAGMTWGRPGSILGSTSDPLFFGVKVGEDLSLGGGLGLENTTGADFALYSNGTDSMFLWEVSNQLAFGLTEDADGEIGSKVALHASFAPAVVEDPIITQTGDMTAAGDLRMGDLDLKLEVVEDETDGLVSGLAANVYYGLYDVLGKNADTDLGMGMEMGLGLSYKAMLGDTNYVKPGAGFNYDFGIMDTDYADNEKDQIMDMNFYVEAMVIPNTTFTLKYATNQLLDEMTGVFDDHEDTDKVGIPGADLSLQDMGRIWFATKISF